MQHAVVTDMLLTPLQGSEGLRLWARWEVRLRLAKQAAAAIAYMHTCGIIHRDVTSSNILVSENWEAKVRSV